LSPRVAQKLASEMIARVVSVARLPEKS